MADPYHVRLAISQYGDQFRAELFTEDLGDTDGDLLPAKWELLNDDFKSYLVTGASSLPSDTARKVGQEMFSYLLGKEENSKKWIEILQQAERQGRPVRLLIDATSDAVRDLPYGLLCDPHDDYFLVRRPEIQFVRILRRCTPRALRLDKGRLRVLVVAAEPDKLPKFDCARRLLELSRGVAPIHDLLFCSAEGVQTIDDVVTGPPEQWRPEQFSGLGRATSEAVRRALQTGEFDVLHLLAHGYGGGVMLCNAEGKRAEVTSGEFGEWCGASKLQIAFLQVCKASMTDGRGGFGGLAQQLLNPKYGNLGAVVASPYPVDAERSMEAVIGFYQALAEGRPLDAALDRRISEANWVWAFLELWVRPSALTDTGRRGAFQFASPYRGLSRFEERDHEVFFGRDAETAELVKILRDDPFLAVVGDSGSGKSSLLQAGLTHYIRQHGLAGRKGWQIISIAPGDHPAQRLISRLVHGDQSGTVDMPMTQNWESELQWALDQSCSTDKPLLLIFDQFEEIFTLCRDDQQRGYVAKTLAWAAQTKPDCFRLLLGMRSEYLGQAAALPGLIQLIKRPWVLKPPGDAEVRAIVADPAEHHGYVFEDRLDDGNPEHARPLLERILADPLLRSSETLSPTSADASAQAEPTSSAPLPLLEFALERLWLKAVQNGSREFRHADYDAMGGLGGSIAQHAEESHLSLSSHPELLETAPANSRTAGSAEKTPADPQKIAEQIWTGLISSRGTRRPRARHELELETGHPELARTVIDYLVGERLLTIRSNAENLSQARVDITHEVLIQRWSRLQTWLSADSETRALRESFQRDAEQWNLGLPGAPPRSNRNLPSLEAQTGYMALIAKTSPRLTDIQQAFANAMRGNLRRRKWLVRVAVAACLLVAVAMSGLALYAFREKGKTKQALDESQRRLVLNYVQRGVTYCVDDKPETGMSWLLSAYELTHPGDPIRDSVLGLMAAWDKSLGKCLMHDGPVLRVAVTPDYKQVISVSHEGGIWLWDTDSGQPIGEPRMHGAHLDTAAISPSGQYVVTCGRDGKTRLWSLVQNGVQGKLLDHGGAVTVTRFSPDSTHVVTCGNDGKVVVWTTKSGERIWAGLLPDANDFALAVAFSADGKRLLTGSDRGTVQFWDAVAGQRSGEPFHEQHAVVSVAFSPDSQWAISATASGTARLWDLAGTENHELVEPKRGRAHLDRIDAVAFSPDSTVVVTGSMDNTARIWDVHTQRPLGFRLQHGGPALLAVFNSDGSKLLTGSGDGTVRQWNPETGEPLLPPLQHDAQISSLAFASADGKRIVSGDWGYIVRLWNIAELEPLFEFSSGQEVTAVAFSPDGKLLAVGCDDGTLQLWDAVAEQLASQQPPPHPAQITGVAFSPDGKTLLTGSVDQTARIWRLADRQVIATFQHDQGVTGVAFAPDGQTAITGCLDGGARIWSVATGQLQGAPVMHDEPVTAVAFSPDGKTFATGCADQKARLWNTQMRSPIAKPLEHRGEVVALAFDPVDGSKLLTGSWDGTAQIWDAKTGLPISDPLSHKGPRVVAVAYSPDGKTVLTGSWEGNARLWDAETGMSRGAAIWHEPRVYAVAFNPDSKSFVTGSNSKTVRLWPLAPAVADDPDRIPIWIELRTGKYWDEQENLSPLGHQTWRSRHEKLQTLGGPPVR